MSNTAQQIIEQLKKRLASADIKSTETSVGTILEVGDGIAIIAGLPEVMASELLEFQTKERKTVSGVALNLLEDTIGAVILGNCEDLKAGGIVRGTGRVLSVPAGEALVGRVVNPLGEPGDGKGQLKGVVKQYP